MSPENLFAGGYLDRRADARLKSDWLEEARADPDTVYVVMRGSTALMRGSGAQLSLALLSAADERVRSVADPDRMLLLGWYREHRCLLLELPEDLPQAVAEEEAFAELRPLASQLPAQDAGLLAYARALSLWRSTHRFCSRCGHTLHAERAGHARACRACGYQSFPRIDPAIIVLVQNGDRALLGRQAGWPQGRYSTIAGFVEPGESLEDAVRREVAEETGIEVGPVRYLASQPWPYPSSLMIGCHGAALSEAITLDPVELEDALWVTRTEMAAALAGTHPKIRRPRNGAIAGFLLTNWVADRLD